MSPRSAEILIVALVWRLRRTTRELELRGPSVLSGETWGPMAKAAFRRAVLVVKFACVVATLLYTRCQEPRYLQRHFCRPSPFLRAQGVFTQQLRRASGVACRGDQRSGLAAWRMGRTRERGTCGKCKLQQCK